MHAIPSSFKWHAEFSLEAKGMVADSRCNNADYCIILNRRGTIRSSILICLCPFLSAWQIAYPAGIPFLLEELLYH